MTDTLIGDAHADLLAARNRYAEAESNLARAHGDMTAALNKLNAAQKAFRKIVDEEKQLAPPDRLSRFCRGIIRRSESDWAREATLRKEPKP